MKIAFLHPDLGLGGAERLVVDAGRQKLCRNFRCVLILIDSTAIALQQQGHEVTIYTAHHDPCRSNVFLVYRLKSNL